jgi:hypothetical protein
LSREKFGLRTSGYREIAYLALVCEGMEQIDVKENATMTFFVSSPRSCVVRNKNLSTEDDRQTA